MLPDEAERKKLARLLEQLTSSIEELFQSGLTTASTATRQTLTATTQEAARFRLLRLGSTLRTANEELGRYLSDDAAFSRKRLTFFLGRAWLLSRGLSHALQTGEERLFDQLNWSPANKPVSKVEMVCIGVLKRVSPGAFAAFDFRFRSTADSGSVSAGQSISWSFVFPCKPGVDIAPEGFLHLPQKQKFAPISFLEGRVVSVEQANIVADENVARLSLSEQSAVNLGSVFEGWTHFLNWSPQAALSRIKQHTPSPLDLDVEMQTEVALTDYEVGPPQNSEVAGTSYYPIRAGNLTLQAVVGPGEEKTVRKELESLQKLEKDRPPIFGLMHYERCRFVFQLLSTFSPQPNYVMISPGAIDKTKLLKALSFK
jgi:hypothetical protein